MLYYIAFLLFATVSHGGQHCQGDPNDPQYKIDGITRVTAGYNIFEAEPIYFESHKDKGVKNGHIFDIKYSDTNSDEVWTDDCNYLKPSGMNISPMDGTCNLKVTSNTVSGMNSYKSSIEASLSVGGSYTGVGASGTFSLNSEYSKVSSVLSSKKSVLITASAQCISTEVTLTPGQEGSGGTPLDPLFIDAINTLAGLGNMEKIVKEKDFNAEIVDAYYTFSETYGTHFNTQVSFGHKYGKRYQMSKSAYQSMQEQKISVDAAAEGSSVVYSGDVKTGVSSETEEQEKFDNAVEATNIMTIGTAAPADGEINTWSQNRIQLVGDSPALPIHRSLLPISNLIDLYAGQFKASEGELSNIKANLKWFLQNYCLVAKARNQNIDCSKHPPDASIYQHSQQVMQWTTGVQGGNKFVRECRNYQRGNHVVKIVGRRQRGYGIVEFRMVCDQKDDHTFTGNSRGWEEKLYDATEAEGFIGIDTWRQRNYGIVNLRMLTTFDTMDWSGRITQSTQYGESHCVSPAKIVGLEVMQMTSRGVVNVRAICYEVGQLCRDSGCRPNEKTAEFMYGYLPSFQRGWDDNEWVDMYVPTGGVPCDKETMGAKFSINNPKCRWRSHPKLRVEGTECAKYGKSCTCDGEVRMCAPSYSTDWKPNNGVIYCRDGYGAPFPDLDFSLYNSEKWCECRPQSSSSEVEVAQARIPHVKSENELNTESVLVLLPGSLTTRMLALVGLFAVLKILHGACKPGKEYETILESQNEI